MFKDFHDRMFRQNRELERDQRKSDPLLHGPIGLGFASLVGGPLYWIVMVGLQPVWCCLFVAVGLSFASPSTLEAILSSVAQVSGVDFTGLDPFHWFWLFLVSGIPTFLVGYVREQRNLLLAEGRLKQSA